MMRHPNLVRSALVFGALTFAAAARPAAAGDDIVLHARNASTIAGTWSRVADSTAAGGARVAHPGLGAATLTTLASPANYATQASTPAPSGGADVAWMNTVNATASGSTLTKTSGCSGCFDAGGISQQAFTSGTLSFTVDMGQTLYVGLGTGASANAATMNYAFRFDGGTSWEVREANVYKTEGAYATGDVFGIGVDAAGTVTYYQNGSPVYTSQVASSGTLVAAASISMVGSAVSNVIVNASTTTLPPDPGPAPTPPPAGGVELRVLQWNVHHGGFGTDGVYDPDRVATWAASFNPDVVTFNEIEKNDYWGYQDQPEVYKALLQQKTGKTWYYVFAQEFGQWDANGKGNLILSSYPIQIFDRYELMNNYDRSIAMAKITVNNCDITLMLTHLDPYDASLRLTQATEVTNWAAPQPENRILIGDMNAWPDQSSIAHYNTLYNDSWAVAAASGTAIAFPGNDGQTKNGRIDYIFYSKNATNLTVGSSQVYDTRDANGIMPSDHRPVLTSFWVQ